MDEDRLFTVALAAKHLGISYQKLWWAIGKGWCEVYQKDPVTLIKESDLQKYAESQSIEQAS